MKKIKYTLKLYYVINHIVSYFYGFIFLNKMNCQI
jgi:hypothetical protein